LFSWKAHGSYISEQVGVSRMITELLLQSVDNVIRVFPAWPKDKDAEFAGLRAQGGFLVSACQTGGVVGGVTIESTSGGTVRLVSPWVGSAIQVIEQQTEHAVTVTVGDAFVSFPTETAGTYSVRRKQ
jgi:hypothetical protein